MVLERVYQPKLIRRLRREFPGIVIIKNDTDYQQGFPDWTLLYHFTWAVLEIKKRKPRPGTSDFEPNQEWFLEELNHLCFAACVYPENEEEIIDALKSTFSAKRPTRVSRS